MMTTKAKVLITLVLLAVVGVGVYQWKDKIFPPAKQQGSINPAAVQEAIQQGTKSAQPAATTEDVTKKLLAGDKAVSLVDGSSIPAVQGVSDYVKEMKDGKLIVNFPINIWPGWAPIIVANNGMEPNEQSVFFKKHGFYLKLSIVDDPVKARDLFASGHSHILWGTLDMMALFAPELSKDSRTVPVIGQQIDFSSGGDGVVARGNIRNVNDLAPTGGRRKKGVLAQNSPSHYFIMSLLVNANIDPAQVDFRWAADAPAAAKIFVQDQSFDFFVGWAPDIYTVSEGVPNTKLIVTTAAANKLVADVWAARNDFYRDHPDVFANLVRGIFEGMDMVRKDPAKAASFLATAFKLPEDDCKSMIGKDGGVAEGDAHLTNYRENANFFLDGSNPAGFDVIWNRASTIYKMLGAIDNVVPASRVKAATVIAKLDPEYKESKDLSQPTFKPGTRFGSAEATDAEILARSVLITFKPNEASLDPAYDTNITATVEEIGKMAGQFGNAYIVIEGNTDASKRGLVPADLVKELSYNRANAVKQALITKYNFNPNKFKVVGNGWDNPVPGLTDSSNMEHNRRNRRVEVKVFKLEGE